MKAQIWHMFVTMVIIICNYFKMDLDEVVNLHCLLKMSMLYEVTTMYCCLGDCQPCCLVICQQLASLGLLGLVALGLLSIAALGLLSHVALGLLSLTTLGLFSFAIELCCPEEGFVSLAAQKKAMLAWLPRKGCFSFATQKRMFQLGCPVKDLKARLPRRGIVSLASPRVTSLIKFSNTNFLLLSECYS